VVAKNVYGCAPKGSVSNNFLWGWNLFLRRNLSGDPSSLVRGESAVKNFGSKEKLVRGTLSQSKANKPSVGQKCFFSLWRIMVPPPKIDMCLSQEAFVENNWFVGGTPSWRGKLNLKFKDCRLWACFFYRALSAFSCKRPFLQKKILSQTESALNLLVLTSQKDFSRNPPIVRGVPPQSV